MNLTVINTTDTSNHKIVVLNGNVIFRSTPGCTASAEEAIKIANNLKQTLNTPINFVKADDAWQELTANSQEKVQANQTSIVLDTVIKDWRLSDPDSINTVPEKDKCEYTLRIEKDLPAQKLWISIYNHAFDKLAIPFPKTGLHCSIEIRDGVPALSVGVSPDENVIHVLSNTSNELAVIPESNSTKPSWLPVDFTANRHLGFCFPVDDYEVLTEARSDLANENFGRFDFGQKIITDESEWESNDDIWEKSFTYEVENCDIKGKGQFVIEFSPNGTHIVKATAS